MGDIFTDIFGMIGGVNEVAGGNIIGVLMLIQLPLILVFLGITGVLFFLLFGNKFLLIMPNAWIFNVTMIRPFAGTKISIFKDKGALCVVNGIKRFKLKKENTLMQRPDTTDVYPNNEVIIISMGVNKKFNGKRMIDYKNHIVRLDVENPKVAQQYYVDIVQDTDPELFYRKIDQLYLLWVLWFFSGVMVAVSNLLVVYPLFVKTLFMG